MPIRTPLTARVGQFWRSPKIEIPSGNKLVTNATQSMHYDRLVAELSPFAEEISATTCPTHTTSKGR